MVEILNLRTCIDCNNNAFKLIHALLNQGKKVAHPNVAGEELRTSGGTYAAVPTNVQALSSGQGIN